MKTIYLTVDVECHDIKKINQFIYGKKKNKQYGLKRILDFGEKNNIPINFFVDVCEAKRYGDDYCRKIINLIQSYRQPIFFHFHENYLSNDDSKTFLWQYSKDEQKKYLDEGIKIFEDFLGNKKRVVFRAGRYGVNRDFYSVMSNTEKDFLDLSYFDGNKKMCKLNHEDTNVFNSYFKIDNVYVLPNTTYIGFDYFRKKESFILNCINTSFEEFSRIIRKTSLDCLIYTMHSWDLIRKYFFIGNYVGRSRYVEKRFQKCVDFAKNNGFSFGNLENFQQYKTEPKDEKLNLCSGFFGKIKGLKNNFIRFYLIGRLNKKYFTIYLLFFFFIFLLVFMMVILVVLI